MNDLNQKIERVVREEIAVTGYNARWPQLFATEKEHLLNLFPDGLILRVEHFGSTAVPGLAAKPIIDMLVEVRSLEETKKEIAPVLESQGYDYFWRPTWGDDIPPYYAWFIKRNRQGMRTHHIHMIEKNDLFTEHWDRLLFRDYLKKHPQTRKEYQQLKMDLATRFKNDRVAYTSAKTKFIQRITEKAKKDADKKI